MNRRDFFYAFCALGACQTWAQAWIKNKKSAELFFLTQTDNKTLNFNTLELDSKLSLNLDKKIHSIAEGVINGENLFIAFPKRGDVLFVFSQNNIKNPRIIKSRPGFLFYGHGLIDPDEGTICALEYKINSTKNARDEAEIVVRQANSLQVIRTLPTFGDASHEFILYNKETILVTNGGKSPNIALIDYKTGLLLKKWEFPSTQWPRHIVAAGPNRHIILPMSPNEALTGRCNPFLFDGQKITKMEIPGHLQAFHTAQILNAFYLADQNKLYTICPDTPGLFRWDMSSLTVEKAITDEYFKDIIYLQETNEFLATSTDAQNLYKIDPVTLKFRKIKKSPKKIYAIAHLSSLYLKPDLL